MFIYHFFIGNIFISIAIVISILFKNIFENKLSAKFNCVFWLPIIILMFIPFVPSINVVIVDSPNINSAVQNKVLTNISNYGAENDLFVSVYSNNFWLYIYIIGVVLSFIFGLIGIFRLKTMAKIKRESYIFEHLCHTVNVKAGLYVSKCVVTPMSYGIFKPVVILPMIDYNNQKFKHIILHELIHHKHKDIIINYVLCLVTILYWFNPFIYIMVNKIRLDMEIYCDNSAIKYTGSNIEYGKTLLCLAEKSPQPIIANYMSGSKNNLKKRIIRIAMFDRKTSKFISKSVFMFILGISIVFSVFVNSYGYTISDNSPNIAGYSVDLSKYYGDNNGCFVLYNIEDNAYTIYNKTMSVKRVAPNSTYKIAIALNGLEKGIITLENNVIKWNGENNYFEQWNKDQNLNTAMKDSVNWYFKNIDSHFSKREIKEFLNTVKYGNSFVGYDKENYWLENTLKISTIEQVEFLNNVYTNKFGFNDENIKAVINSIKLGDNYYGKTGTGMVDGKVVSGWFEGIIIKNGKTYVFASRIDGNDNATGAKAKNITENILSEYL